MVARRCAVVTLVLVLGGLPIACGPKTLSPGSERDGKAEETFDAATSLQSAVDQGDWERASQHVEGALVSNPTDPDVITNAARVEAALGSKRDAAQLLVEAAGLSKYEPISRVQFAVGALIEVGELYKAIDLLEATLKLKPDQHDLRRTLVGFLGEAERAERIPKHLQKLILARRFDAPLLIAMTEQSARRFSSKTIEQIFQRNPNDQRVRLAYLQPMINSRDSKAAAALLNEILERHPKFVPAYARLGQVLMEEGRFDDVLIWAKEAPAECQRYAEYWLALGDLAIENDRLAEGVRGYWEASKCDPNNTTSWSRLVQSIRRFQDTNKDQPLDVSEKHLVAMDARIANLLELRKRFYDYSGGDRASQTLAANVAESLFQLGRLWEAEAWSALATSLKQDTYVGIESLRSQILGRLRVDNAWVATKWDLAFEPSLSSLPLPTLSHVVSDSERDSVIPDLVSNDHVLFVNQTDSWNLQNVGAKNNPTDESLKVLIRTTGVGGGAIDLDLDGAIDLVVMGAGGSMLKEDSQPNQVLRNLDGQFKAVTRESNTVDRGFGQGIAVGDFNEDGWPDLFFGNLGANRLFRNNGDGSFSDCSTDLRANASVQWTTCGAFADIDGDRITDLVITNYCQPSETLNQPCDAGNGETANCHPLEFPAGTDGFFRGDGTGKFIDQSSEWTQRLSAGRGMGLIVGALTSNGNKALSASRSMDVYVANDMTANNFVTWRSDATDATTPLSPDDSAAARGIAVDGRTLTQASMGIAASDLDCDGDLDFYVTGFAKEYNIFYEQISPGLWADTTRRVGLVKPTLMTVGFGTEAIDVDNDGLDELIVTNGHIGVFKEADSVPYAQPLQLFRRGGDGAFALVEDDAWGDYFASDHVGRALFTADVNHDGNSDVLVTHNYESLCLLMNQTRSQNKAISFKLVGTSTSRDAVGATVRFKCGGRPRTVWCLAGDGYMCSNERVVRAGLGKVGRVDDVIVTWQDGTIDRIGDLDANAEYLLVQGSGDAYRLSDFKTK